MAIGEALLTVEEYAHMPDDGRHTELVRGRIVEVPPPNFHHGIVSAEIAYHFMAHVKEGRSGKSRHQ